MENSILLQKSDELAHLVYRITKDFPKEELFGITSQLRRAVLSIPLNITEGFARQKEGSYKQFLLIAYGSLKEVKYLLNFVKAEQFISKKDYQKTINLAEEIGKILWVTIEGVKKKIKK